MLYVNLGDLVVWNDEEYIVAGVSPPATLLRRLCDEQSVWVDLLTLADEIRPAVVNSSASGGAQSVAATVPVDDDALSAARWWVPHLNEVEFGVTDPDDPHAVPRKGYELGTTKAERERLKVEELHAAGYQKVSVRSIQRKQAAYRSSGVHALVDQRTTATTPGVPVVDERVLEATLAVLAGTMSDSTVSITTLIDKIRARLAVRYRKDAPEMPSVRTMRRLIDAYDRRKLAVGKASTRRSESNRHDRGPQPVSATSPGEFVEIDSTPVNVLALMPDGKPARAHLTVALDVATRSILGFDIVPVGATGVEHADLLARILRPRKSRPGTTNMNLSDAGDLPYQAMQACDDRQSDAIAVPYIVPETITTDRGKDYLSETFVSACRHFGIGVIAAPPHSPTYKGHVERLMGTIETSWMQKLPGYIGNSVANRGRHADRADLLTLRELRESFEEWWVRVYQRTPHSELRDRDVPGRCYSPNQMYTALFDAGAGVPVPIDEATFISLMPAYRRTIQNNGIQIDRLTYWNDVLSEFRKMTPPSRDGKWLIRKDPYDIDRVWIQHPEDDNWIECVSDSYQRSHYPFASGLRLLRNTAQDSPPESSEWAAEQLEKTAAQARKGRKPRKAVRDESVKARRQDDSDPRPATIKDPPPPDPDILDEDVDDFVVVRPSDRFWND